MLVLVVDVVICCDMLWYVVVLVVDVVMLVGESVVCLCGLQTTTMMRPQTAFYRTP